MDVEQQVASLLQAPGPDAVAQFFQQATQGLGVGVAADAGGGRGKGLRARRAFAAGELLFQEPPLVAIQHTTNRPRAWVCARCFRFVGSVEEQLGRAASRLGAVVGERAVAAHDGAPGSGAAAPPALALAAAAAPGGRLPCSEAEPLPPAVPCPGRCEDAVYCSAECRDAAWAAHHAALCPAASPALREFCGHADAVNDVFRLAAQVVAGVMLAAERALPPGGAEGATPEARWAALRAAWTPVCMGHKGLWWECVALPPDVTDEAEFRGDLRQFACDSLELLAAALRERCPAAAAAFPALLDPRVYGSLIGMFELNNLSLFVAGPVPRWAAAVEELPAAARAAAEAAGGGVLRVLGGIEGILEEEDAWACEGNAFYSLQACANHSCLPNAHAWKREGDRDGAAVILALRDIAAGEEVTISYLGDAEDAPLQDRAAALADYGFVCGCERCEAERLAEELGMEEV